MNILITIITVISQLIVGQILGFGVAMAVSAGNGWELVVMSIGNVIGVWGVGTLVAVLRKSYEQRPLLIKLAGTAVGSVVGVAVILITPAIGGIQIAFPLVGAILGYYLAPRIIK